MKKTETINTVKNLVENKNQVKAYMKGKITRMELVERGVKLVKPF